MPTTDPHQLLHLLAVGDANVVASLIEEFGGSDDASTVVVVALFASEPGDLLRRAGELAQTTQERQLVAIADAHIGGDHELVDSFSREYLTDHPDSVLVAWIAGAARHDNKGANNAGS